LLQFNKGLGDEALYKTALLNVFTKTQASNECDGENETEEVGNVVEKKNLIVICHSTQSQLLSQRI